MGLIELKNSWAAKANEQYRRRLRTGEGSRGRNMPAQGTAREGDTPGQRGSGFGPDAGAGEGAAMNGGHRAERTFPYTENIVDAEFRIGSTRPTTVIRAVYTNVRFRNSQRSSHIIQEVYLKLGKLQFYH